jgi:hypothetical protein
MSILLYYISLLYSTIFTHTTNAEFFASAIEDTGQLIGPSVSSVRANQTATSKVSRAYAMSANRRHGCPLLARFLDARTFCGRSVPKNGRLNAIPTWRAFTVKQSVSLKTMV